VDGPPRPFFTIVHTLRARLATPVWQRANALVGIAERSTREFCQTSIGRPRLQMRTGPSFVALPARLRTLQRRHQVIRQRGHHIDRRARDRVLEGEPGRVQELAVEA